MKIVLIYKEPGSNLSCYRYKEVFDESEILEATWELEGVRQAGYEIVKWTLVHEGDEWNVN